MSLPKSVHTSISWIGISNQHLKKTNTCTDIIPASYIGHVYAYLFRTDF